jgi:NAD(P)-dependent dehydrogenase (short-subunit alcohol dehydrogenase family)
MRTPEQTVALITGSTDGIGKQTALELARKGAQVIVHGRNPAKAQAAAEATQKAAGAKARVEWVAFDLASLASVRAGAAEVARRFPTLNVLINNAGVFATERRVSADGHELSMAVNHLGHFLLTQLLVPTLVQQAPARVVNVSSGMHQRGRMKWDDIELTRGYDGAAAYAQSKLANVLFTVELAERLSGTGVTVNALHPGVIATKLLREGFGMDGGASLASGAQTSVYVALAPELEKVSGRYFDNSREARLSPGAQDPQSRQKLWTLSEGWAAA